MESWITSLSTKVLVWVCNRSCIVLFQHKNHVVVTNGSQSFDRFIAMVGDNRKFIECGGFPTANLSVEYIFLCGVPSFDYNS